MAFKFIVFAACLAFARAGLIGAPAAYAAAPAVAYSAAPAVSHVSYSSPIVSYGAPLATPTITSQSQNILRSYGNLGQVSTYSKTIDTPFSSVSKSDVRVSNPGLKIAAAPAYAYSAPAYATQAYAAPAFAAQTYAAPAYASQTYAAPAFATKTYAAPAYAAQTYAAPAYAAPAFARQISAPAVAASAIGVAYSAAPAVAHVSYSNGYGINYGW